MKRPEPAGRLTGYAANENLPVVDLDPLVIDMAFLARCQIRRPQAPDLVRPFASELSNSRDGHRNVHVKAPFDEPQRCTRE